MSVTVTRLGPHIYRVRAIPMGRGTFAAVVDELAVMPTEAELDAAPGIRIWRGADHGAIRPTAEAAIESGHAAFRAHIATDEPGVTRRRRVL